ncbi:septation inhibitor protein [Cutibacterium acnes JCM 18909]|nr:septation inhibitor protein [Cutibacterium acnes JCM 18909]
MPESKVRPQAKKKAQAKDRATMDERRAEKKKAAPVDRSWVPKVFVPLFFTRGVVADRLLHRG